MGYLSTTNLERDSIYQNVKKRPKINKKSSVGKKLEITKTYLEPVPLNEEEREIINDITSSNPGVFYKPRKQMQTVISAPEKWHLLWNDEEEYKGWLEFNRLGNPFYNAGELDHLFQEGGNDNG